MRHSSVRNTKTLIGLPIKNNMSVSRLLCASAAFVLLQASAAHATMTLSDGMTYSEQGNKKTYEVYKT